MDIKDKIKNSELLLLGESLSPILFGKSGFENETYIIVDNLWQVLVIRADFKTAVGYLSKVDFDSSNIEAGEEKVFESLLNLIVAQFELGEFMTAENVLRKCHERRRKIKKPRLLVQYNYCCGQYCDFNRKYLEAS